MNVKIFDTYIISQLQFDILLNSMNCNEIFGIERRYDKDKIDKKIVYAELQKMISDGMIIPNMDSLHIEKNIKDCLEIIIHADVTLHLFVNTETNKDYLCYVQGEEVVIITFSTIREKISITKMNMDEFGEIFLVDIFPDNSKDKQDVTKCMEEAERENELINLYKAGVSDYRIRAVCETAGNKDDVCRHMYVFRTEDIFESDSMYVASYIDETREILDYDRNIMIKYVLNEVKNDNG